ncbi:MAG: glycosyltransferase [Cyanomargarita calcarea GSE-NOS-MK-12-04C]|jgi:glycosyltransferase involved in cell wall biosynthesis|uniref:Glycosyltransferase n=1 Tax=Cyanomargarita calcarea GSE-NOS-MK-12-04C TaxID=2839659 RepID=A0A951UT67_9CYAN|nr:glycosyltransferase [Cyanomargarita calcarea GSE-NOS-MK-12-04C]
MPKISVIIPVYNGQKTIKATIESVLQQTLSDFELIVINADSSDSTLNIISQIEDPRLQVFTYPKANVAVNRNRGVSHAIGEFVSFLDADDLWTTDKLEAQYKALLENPNAAIAYSFTDAIDENGRFLRKCSHASWTGDVYLKLLLDDFIGSGSNVTIRKDTFTEISGFDETLTNAQDTDLWLRIAAQHHFVAVTKVQILYRICGDSMSSNLLGLEKSNLQIIERAFACKKAAQLQHLKRYSIANLYKYLSYKSLEVPLDKRKTIIVIRYLWQVVITDPYILFKPVIYKALLKLVAINILPSKQAQKLFNKFPNLSNTSTFFGYIKSSLD